jgi:hypothetical protein
MLIDAPMLFNVPQYIDVEDKVAGPLTAKQLLWMIGMSAVLLVLWNIFDLAAFFAAAIPVVLIFVALAFYRPYNQPLIVFVKNALFFLIRPKVYVWNRPSSAVSRQRERPVVSNKPETGVKVLDMEEIRRLADMVDQNKR